MKTFRSRAVGALDCLWQVGLLSGIAAFFVGAVVGARQTGLGGYVPIVCIAAIAAYGIIFTRLDPKMVGGLGHFAGYACIPLVAMMMATDAFLPVAAALFFVVVQAPCIIFSVSAAAYNSFQQRIGFDPVEHALVRIGFGPVSKTGRGVLRLTALFQLFGLVLASGPSASAAGYGNFCLTLLLIGTFGGSLAVYFRDSTPD